MQKQQLTTKQSFPFKVKIPHEKRTVRVKFTSPVLGSAPNTEEIYETYVVSKLIKEIERLEKKYEKVKDKDRNEADILWDRINYLKEQLANSPDIPDTQETKKTVFYRHPETGNPVIKNFQVQGFLKEVANNFKSEFGIKGFKDKISRYVKVYPVNIPIYFEGELIQENDLLEYQRPLRAWLPSGQQIVSIAISEMLEEDTEIEFDIYLLKNKDVKIDDVLKLLDYGVFGGIGQWRSAGFGAFEVLEISE